MPRHPIVYFPGFEGPYRKDYFKRPTLEVKRRSEDTEDALLIAVGAALTRWERFEGSVVQMFAQMLAGSQNPIKLRAAYRAIGSIESSATRRGALEQVAQAHLEDSSSPLAASIRLLFDNASEAARRRDEFAHGEVSHAANIVDKGLDVVGNFLWAPRYNLKRNDHARSNPDDVFPFSTSRYRYTSADIAEFGVRFAELEHALILLLCEISEDLKGQVFPGGRGFV